MTNLSANKIYSLNIETLWKDLRQLYKNQSFSYTKIIGGGKAVPAYDKKFLHEKSIGLTKKKKLIIAIIVLLMMVTIKKIILHQSDQRKVILTSSRAIALL